jgi:hypothetical protein
VQRSAFERFMELLEPAVKSLAVGDPADPATAMGPLISARHLAKVTSYIDEETAVAFRGSAPRGPGFWFPPTVLAPVAATSRQRREEIFGPVIAVMPFEDEEGTRPGRRRVVHRDQERVHRDRGVRPVGWPDAAENAAPSNGCRRRARPHAAVR